MKTFIHTILLAGAVAIMMGCATVDTRLYRSPSKVSAVFPSTRCVPRYIHDFSRGFIPRDSGDPGTALIVLFGVFVYPVMEFGAAIPTDLLLLPMDAYFLWRNAAKRRNARERLLENTEEKERPSP